MDARLLSGAQADNGTVLGVRDAVRLRVLDSEGRDDEVCQRLCWDLWNSYDYVLRKECKDVPLCSW